MHSYLVRTAVALGAAAAMLSVAIPAQAQDSPPRRRGIVEVDQLANPRWLLGITAMLARPTGEFREFVDWGGGLGIYATYHFDEGRHIGLRLDGSHLVYGHERFSAPLSTTIPRIGVDVTTSNFITNFGIGPQINFARGPVRPYVYGTVGFSYFATVSSVSGDDDVVEFASDTNFDDVTGAVTFGGGLLLQFNGGNHPVSLDLAVQSTHNGEATYLRRGGITDLPDGTVLIRPIESDANLVNFRLGIAIGL
jgi:hypothetical protein